MSCHKINNDAVQSEIAMRIKALRAEHNESQEQLAKALAVSKAQIQNIEQDRTNLSIDIALSIAQHYNVSLDYLCTGNYGISDMKAPQRILESLKDVFELTPGKMSLDLHKPTPYFYDYFTLKISAPLNKYLRSVAAAQSMLKDGNIEKDFYEDWIKGAQQKFNESFDTEKAAESIEFVVLPASDLSDEMIRVLEEDKYQQTRKNDTAAQQ